MYAPIPRTQPVALVAVVAVLVAATGYIAFDWQHRHTAQRTFAALEAAARPTRPYYVTVGGKRFLVTPKGYQAPIVGDVAPVVSEPPTGALVPQGEMEAIAFAAADQFGIERALARALMTQESGGDPNARSSVGATGLMQVMPATATGIAADLGVASYDLTDPTTNATFGMYYLREKLDRYGSVAWALAAYNWGPGAVDGFLSRHPEAQGMAWGDVVGAWGGEIPGETQGYVTTIAALTDQARAETPPVAAVALVATGVSAPITVDGSDFGQNVRAALGANGGALQRIVIQPGTSWSFNETIGDPGVLDLRTVSGVLGGGWCDLASRYVQALRPILPPSAIVFPLHGVALNQVSYEDSVVIWSNGTRGGQDLIVTNTLDRPIVLTAENADAAQVVVTAAIQ